MIASRDRAARNAGRPRCRLVLRYLVVILGAFRLALSLVRCVLTQKQVSGERLLQHQAWSLSSRVMEHHIKHHLSQPQSKQRDHSATAKVFKLLRKEDLVKYVSVTRLKARL